MNNINYSKINKLGNKIWYNEQNQYHRDDGPAVEWADGSKEWWLNGNLHREDGPAVEYADGYKEWRLNGELYTEEEWMLRTLQHVDPKTKKAYKDILSEL